MSYEEIPANRIAYSGPLDEVLERAVAAYELENFDQFEAIPVGYEDFNIRLRGRTQDYLIKIFAAFRTPEEIQRFGDIMQAVASGGVRIPPLYEAQGTMIYTDHTSGLSMVAMDFIKGKTYYELKRSPTDDELAQILEQAVRINRVAYRPNFLADSWSVANLTPETFAQVEAHMDPADRERTYKVVTDFAALDKDALPHCLVHGDIIKSNTLLGSDGQIYILDFSVTNWYPRLSELAVIIGNLLNDPASRASFGTVQEKVVAEYLAAGGQLEPVELAALPIYARAGYAVEYVSGLREKYVNGNMSAENEYWLELGRVGLAKSFE